MSSRPVFAALLGLALLAGPATADPLTNIEVVPANTNAGELGNHAVNFTVSVTDGCDDQDRILITYPAGFDLTGGIAATTTTMGGGATLSVSVAGQVVTVARQNNGNNNVSGPIGVLLTNVRNANIGSYTVTVEIQNNMAVNQHGPNDSSAFSIVLGPTRLLEVTGITDPVTAGTASGVTVRATDAAGNTTPTYTGTVTFSSTDGAATLPANYTFVAGDNGQRSFPGGVTLVTAGLRSVTATDTVTGTITGTQSNIDVNPGPAQTLSLTGITDPITAGVADTFTVTALDGFGNTATGYTGTVTFSSTDPAAILPANYTYVGGDAGTRTFSVTLRTAGVRAVTATDTVTGTITGTQSNIDVNPAGAATLQVTGVTDPVQAGTASGVTVTARDAFNNVATGYTGTIAFSSNDGAATLPANYTFVGGDAGVRSFPGGVTLRTAGVRSVTATDTVTGTITGSQTNIDVTPAATSQLLVAGIADPITAGVADNFTVTAADQFGNTTPTYTGTVQFTSTDPAAILPANYTFVALDAGSRTFSVTLRTSGVRAVTATDTVTPAITGTQSNIDVNAAAAATLIVAGIADPVTAGTADNFTVTAQDAFGNTATGYTGTVTFTSTDPSATLPANYTYVGGDAGVRTFSVTLRTAGVRAVTATDTVTPAITGTQSNIDVNPGPTTQLLVAGVTDPVTAGTASGVTVTARDSEGNTTPAYTGTITFTSNDGAATLPANYTFVGGDAGVRSFPGGVILRTAGVRSVTATDTVTGSITGTQSNIDVNPGAATQLVVAGIADPITAGAADNFTVTARDALNNTATGYLGTITFTSTDPAAVLPANYTFVAGDAGVRTFSVELRTAGVRAVTATDTVTASITGTQSNIDVNPDTGTQLAFISQPTGTGTNTNIPGSPGPGIQVAVQDQFGNLVSTTETINMTINTGPGGATLSGTTGVACVGGIATFSNLQLNVDGDYTLNANDAGGGLTLTAVNSNTFTIGVFRWTGNALNGNWQDAGNWTPGLPSATDRVVFDATTSPNAAGSPPTNNSPANLGSLEVNANYTANVTITADMALQRDVLVPTSANPGTLQLGGFVLSAGGNGTIGRSPANGTVRFTGTFTATPTLTLGGGVTFPTLRVSGGTLSLQNAVTLSAGTLQIDAGATLDTNTTFDPAVNVTTSTVLDGALTGNNSSLTLANLNQSGTGNLTLTGPGALVLNGNATLAGAATFSAALVTANAGWNSSGAGVVTFSGASELRFAGAGPTINAGLSDSFRTLRVQNGLVQAGATLDINANLIIDGGTFTLLAGAGADIEGTVAINAGAWNLNGALASVGGGTDATILTTGPIIDAPAGSGTLSIEAAGGGNSVGGAANITVGNLTVAQGRANLTSPLTTVLQTTTISGGTTLGGPTGTLDTVNLTFVTNGAYAEGTGLTQVSGNLTLSATSTWTDDGTGELQLDGAGQQWNGGDRSVGNVRANGTGVTLVTSGARVTTLIVAAGCTFSVGSQTLTVLGTTNPPLSVAGNLTGTSGGVTYAPAVATALTLATGANVAYPNLTLTNAGQTFSALGALNVSVVLDITAGSLSLGNAVTLTLSGAGTPFTAGGTLLMAANATVAYTGAGAVTMRQGTYPANVSVGGAAAGAFASGTSVVNGTLTIGANATLTVVDLTLGATGTPLVVTGALSTGSGVVRYTAANATVTATTFPNLDLVNGAFVVAGNVTAALDLTLTGTASLAPGPTLLTARSVSGAGTLNLTGTNLRLTGSTNPFGLANVLGILSSTINYAGNSPQVRSVNVPQLTYGNLVLSGGGTATLVGGGTNLYVAGNLSLQVNTTFAGTIELETGGPPTVSFACGSSPLTLAGLILDKAVGQTVQISGADFVQRTIQNLTLTQGIFDVQCDLTIVQGTVGVAGGSGTAAELVVAFGGVDLTIGDGTNRTLTINDVFRFSQPALNMRLLLGATGPASRATLLLNDPAASLTFVGIATNQVQIESTTLGQAGLIVRPQANAAATITAVNVSVRDNDASGVLSAAGLMAPIQAQPISIDRGNTPNWVFAGGGALRISAATALGDGDGSIDRVRLVYSLPLDPATVGNSFQQFTLRQLGANPGDPPLQVLTGTAANVIISQNDNVLEVTFGAGVARTDVAGLELRYTPPASGLLASDTGIPATLAETISPSTTPPLRDGAPPVVINAFFQDVDLNGGHDRLNMFCSEPAAFAPARGISVSGFGGVTSTLDLGANTSLTLQLAGEAAVAINLTPGGVPRLSGALIAARIQEAVRALVATNPTAIPGHDPLKRPAYSNFTCTFSGGRYLLRAGGPLAFDAGTGTYRQDWAGSSVVIVPGANDAAPQLRLGVVNGGVERAGAGDGRTGFSISAPIDPDTLTITAGTDANLRLAGEDLRAYNYAANTVGLENVALVLETLVRASTNEAQSPPNQTAYSDFVAVPDRPRGRLVLVPGQALGPGSTVEVASGAGQAFASAAAIGTASAPAGASQPAGAANGTVSLSDLSVRGQDGSNLLLGKTAADLTITGNVVVVALTNDPAAGLATPSFSFGDDGDGAFLCDRAQVLNTASGGANNLPADNPVVLVGDTDGDLTLTRSPGAILLDAGQSLLPLGQTGVSASFSWDFVSGPGAIVVNGVTLGPPFTGVSTNPAFSFAASAATTAGAYVFQLTITLLDGAGQPVVNAATDQSGRVITTVTVNVSEDPPVAVLSVPPVTVGPTVLLDGSGSFDPNGGAITFQWSANDSLGLPVPASAFDDPTLAQPTFMPAALGAFTVTVTVRKVADPTLTASASAGVSLVDAGNLPPFADAGNDLTGRVNALIALDGRRSLDPEGTALTFAWTPVTLAAPAALSDPTAAQPTFTPIVPGAYTWRLTVTETSGQTDTDEVTVVVIDDLAPQPRLGPAAEPRVAGLRRSAFLTQAPATTAGVPPVIVLERGLERTVTLIDRAGDASDDPAPGATTGLIGVHAVVGASLFASYYAAPLPGDGEAVAIRFGPGQADQVLIPYGVTGQPFVLDGTRSQDDGVIASFTWRQVSGPFQFSSRSGNLLAVVPQTAGTYVFELTVTDNVGLTSLPRQVTVPVVPAGNPAFGPPSAVAGAPSGSVASPARVLPALTVTGSAGQTVTLQGSASISRNGGNLTFLWEQLSGPLATLTNADTASLGVSAKAPGAYRFRLTVTDQNGVAASEVVWVTFGAPGRTAPVARVSDPPGQVLPADGTGLELALDGAASTGDGPLQYRWSQARGVPLVIDVQSGGQATGTSPTARVRLTQPGIYELVLEVTDQNGVTSSPDTTTFEVQGAGDPTLSSGASFKESSGGCALQPGPGTPPAAWPLLGLALLALLRRRRAA